jgi:hypothetical protein
MLRAQTHSDGLCFVLPPPSADGARREAEVEAEEAVLRAVRGVVGEADVVEEGERGRAEKKGVGAVKEGAT